MSDQLSLLWSLTEGWWCVRVNLNVCICMCVVISSTGHIWLPVSPRCCPVVAHKTSDQNRFLPPPHPPLFILHWLPGHPLPKPNHKVCYWSRAVPAGAITWPVLFNFIQSLLLLLLHSVSGLPAGNAAPCQEQGKGNRKNRKSVS